MNAKLFINYRREDTAPYAGRLYDRLTAQFGEDQVFIDIDQIEPGEDFVEVINRKVGTCDIAIVAIGPNWLGATDASGKRRLDDAEDFVRMEIVAALRRKIRVIPVLVGGARMPRRQDLPKALAPLSRRNAIELSETRFHADVNRLIEAIEKSLAVAEKEAELSTTPVVPPAEPASVRSPESKDPFIRKQKQKLLQLRDAVVDSMAGVAQGALRSRAEDSEASAFGMHQADAGSDAYDRDFALSLLSQERDALYEIDEALKRIEVGTYGKCEMSGKAIPRARLEAIPFARFTVECQSQLEKQSEASRARPSVTSLFGLTEEDAAESEEEEAAPPEVKE